MTAKHVCIAAWPARPYSRSRAVANNAGVAAAAAIANNSISTWATFCCTVFPIDVCVASTSADACFFHLFNPLDREMDQNKLVNGLTLRQWNSAFRPGIVEFAATTFTYTEEGANLVRIALGNFGPHTSLDGGREPVFTHAVMLPREVAVELAGMLLKLLAAPED